MGKDERIDSKNSGGGNEGRWWRMAEKEFTNHAHTVERKNPWRAKKLERNLQVASRPKRRKKEIIVRKGKVYVKKRRGGVEKGKEGE